MKKLLLNVLFVVLGLAAAAQAPGSAGPTVLSVADIVGNYGLDSAMVNDTAVLTRYLDAQPQDYVALTNLCVNIRTRAQKAIQSIENDYAFRDSLIWIDSNTVLSDYSIYEYRLRLLADYAGRQSIRYSRLEQQRIEVEKEEARRRAEEEARRQQQERDNMASDLRGSIDLHHRAIISACDGVGITDKNKLKELKDLYYSYLMVYNKYDLSTGHATDESIARLDELNAFQNDLLENVLGANSLPNQIENFKNVLKVRCEKDYSDIYRSYSRVFKHTSVPVSFADVREYEDYINRMRTIVNVQQRYLQTIELRSSISHNSDQIAQLYGKKYRDVVSSYRDVVKGVNQLPAFTTNAESLVFVQGLEEFIQAQQIYLDDYVLLEDLSARSDSIVRSGRSRFYDVVVAYRDVEPSLRPIPAFRDAAGAAMFENTVAEMRRVQECYLEVIDLRQVIAHNDDTLGAARKVDRTLGNGYRLLSRQVNLKPAFSTVERGHSFIDMLKEHIEMQELALRVMHKLQQMEANAKLITAKDSPYRNITKAYTRMEKSYRGIDDITNLEDLRRYERQCDNTIDMQEAFLRLIKSPNAADSDLKLKRESDLSKIRLILGI